MNNVFLTGNVGRDAEMRYTPQGKKVANFSFAVPKRYTRSDGERVDETLWINISAWGELADWAGKNVVKGMKLVIQGRLDEPYVYGEPAKSQNQVTATYIEVSVWKDRQGLEEEEEELTF